MKYILARLKEPSTYVGLLTAIASLASLQIGTEAIAQIAAALATVAGLILAGQKSHGAD